MSTVWVLDDVDVPDAWGNPWHDERGRFAPKGTGRSVATKGVTPPPEPAKPAAPSMGGAALWKSLDKTSTTNADPAELKARDAYISNGKGGYKDMNGCSRGKGCSKATTKKNEELDSLIGKSALPADADLHRGVTFKSAAERDAFVAGLTPGGSFADKGFFSTTADPKVVQFFQTSPGQSVLFRVHAPAGTHATTGEQSEREVIFGRGQQWRVRSVGGNGRPPVIELESVGSLAASAAPKATPAVSAVSDVALSAGFLDRMSDIVLEPVAVGLTASAWKPAGVLDDFDARYLGKMTAALDDSYKRMRALAVSRLRASALVASPFTLDDPNVFTAQDWADMFSVDAVDIIGDVVVDAATGSPLKIGLNLSDDDLVKLVDAHVQHLLGVGSDVAQSVSDTMQMAVKDGWSVDQTARELAATGPFSPDGARSFARTEISSAANAGMVAGWTADGTLGKTWASVHDSKTRYEHLVADGQSVPVGQDFNVGGYPASAPGDLRLPPALRIACRCTVEAVNAGGKMQAASIDSAGKKDLYRLAAQLKVRGRSTMSKAQLFDSIDAYRRGEGVQRIDRQTRAQLLTRAKDAGIKGRHGMDTATLRAELFARAPGARRALDAGYVVEGELSAIRAQVASVLKRTAIVAGAGWIED